MSAVFTRTVIAHAEHIEIMPSGKLSACRGHHIHMSLLKISSIKIVHPFASCECFVLTYCYHYLLFTEEIILFIAALRLMPPHDQRIFTVIKMVSLSHTFHSESVFFI